MDTNNAKPQTESSASLIRCREVEVRLGQRVVLQDVNFEVQPGKIHMLVGPNGGGKTTLFRLLLGLTHATRGEIEWQAPSQTPSSKAFPMGYVAQRSKADFRYPLTVRDVIAMVRPGPADCEVVESALSRLKLEALADRPISQLSGGQQQRVLIARALAVKAPVLFLDEPNNGLDRERQEDLLALLVELRDKHDVAVLFSSHHPGSALTIVDRGFRVDRSVSAVPLNALEDHHEGPCLHGEEPQ